MAKGFAVVSGSNNTVFRALETGLTVFGSAETDTDMRVTGSVNITGSLHLNGVDVDQKLKDLFDDLDPADLDSIKELSVAQKITSSVTYEDVSAVWASAQAPVEDSIVESGGLILRGPRPGWRFAKSVYPSIPAAKIAWYFYNGDPTTGGENRTLGSLQDMYAVVTMDSTNSNSIPYFAVYTVPQGDGQDASWYRSRSVYVDLGSQTLVSGTKYLFHFGDEAPLVHPELPRIKLGWADPATYGAGGSVGLEDPSERILYIGLASDSSNSTSDFVVESIGLRFGDGSTDDSIREIKLDIRNRSMGSLNITGDATISGSLTVGTDYNDLLNVQSRLRVPKILRTDTAALAYMSANAADLEGEIFYLKGAGDNSSADFPEGNKFYYNEGGRWFETNSFWG